jgi:hypothetical protein
LIRICRKEGLEDVVTYQSSGELMAALPGEQPECLIVDLHMPEMTGLQIEAAPDALGRRNRRFSSLPIPRKARTSTANLPAPLLYSPSRCRMKPSSPRSMSRGSSEGTGARNELLQRGNASCRSLSSWARFC